MPTVIDRKCKSDITGFTLIELLVVVAIIAILVGILLPAITRARQSATKAACSANLHQVGMGIQVYQQNFADKFPVARYMPYPFKTSSSDPSLPQALEQSLTSDTKVYHCPGDQIVFEVTKNNPDNKGTGMSYTYNNSLAGQQLDDTFFSEALDFPPSEIFVCYDCDGKSFDLIGTPATILVPSFHNLRNLLFADGHVGNYK